MAQVDAWHSIYSSLSPCINKVGDLNSKIPVNDTGAEKNKLEAKICI